MQQNQNRERFLKNQQLREQADRAKSDDRNLAPRRAIFAHFNNPVFPFQFKISAQV
ncbi:MAG: hypothetical protein RLZZ28_784 [Bacteroidota bacterium]